MPDFDNELERKEEEEEERKAAKLVLHDFQVFVRARSCIFMNDDDSEILHGRITGLMKELEMVVIRDLRPGRERLGVNQMIPMDNIKYVCTSDKLEKCKKCLHFSDLKDTLSRDEKEKVGGNRQSEKSPGDKEGDGLRQEAVSV